MNKNTVCPYDKHVNIAMIGSGLAMLKIVHGTIDSLKEDALFGNEIKIRNAEEQRSLLTSAVSNVVTVIIKLFLEKRGVTPLNNFIFIQMFLGNILGFVLDQVIATKEGYALFKKKDDLVRVVTKDNVDLIKFGKDAIGGTKISLIEYAFKKVGSAQFLRFLITILNDIIISTTLYSYVSRILKEKKCSGGKVDLFIQSFIGALTFYMYVNATRLGWAYKALPTETETLGVMALLVGSSLAYLAAKEYTDSDIFEKRNGKMVLVLFAFTLVFIHKLIYTNNLALSGNANFGKIVFIGSVLLCFAGAFMIKINNKKKIKKK
jgi:hypothetical protein